MTDEIVAVSRIRRLARAGAARRIRVHAAVSVRELATAIEVDPATLSRWENGKASPRREAAIRWSDALNRLGEEPKDGAP